MKKKILSITLVIALVAIAAMGTLAYFTDTENATNTFVAGGVNIDLIEQQRDYDEEGNLEDALVDFEQNKTLMPIVGSAQNDLKDQFGLPTSENYVDKIVTVENTGKSDAYIRAYYAVPSALDDGLVEGFNAGMNILHGNFGNYMGEDGEWHTTFQNQWIWKHENAEGVSTWNYFETTMDGVAYNVYFADYYIPLAPNAITEQLIQGVYLDKNVDMDDEGNYIDPRHPNADLSILKGTINYPVYAVAVQAAGFDSVDAAITAAFGAQYNPWGGTVTNWQ